MISAFGKSVAIAACKKGTQLAELKNKMIRGEHLPTLFVAAREHGVTGLDLEGNQLGVSGAETLGTLLSWDTRITAIKCVAAIACLHMLTLWSIAHLPEFWDPDPSRACVECLTPFLCLFLDVLSVKPSTMRRSKAICDRGQYHALNLDVRLHSLVLAAWPRTTSPITAKTCRA